MASTTLHLYAPLSTAPCRHGSAQLPQHMATPSRRKVCAARACCMGRQVLTRSMGSTATVRRRLAVRRVGAAGCVSPAPLPRSGCAARSACASQYVPCCFP